VGSQPGSVYVEVLGASLELGDIASVLSAVPGTSSDSPPNVEPAADKVRATGVSTLFINSGGLKVPTLKVSKWQGAFNADGTVKDGFLDGERETDHFKVRVVDRSKRGNGTVTAKISADSVGTIYDDDGTVITLTETGEQTGVFESKMQMLVSDKVDDEQKFDGVADDAQDDRSHLVSLNGSVHAEYAFGEGKVSESSAKVPALKEV
jgi:hypothetical protein